MSLRPDPVSILDQLSRAGVASSFWIQRLEPDAVTIVNEDSGEVERRPLLRRGKRFCLGSTVEVMGSRPGRAGRRAGEDRMLNLSRTKAAPRTAAEPGAGRELVVSSAERAPSLRAADFAAQLMSQDPAAGAVIMAALLRGTIADPAPRVAHAPAVANASPFMPIPRGQWDPEQVAARYHGPLPQTDPSWGAPPRHGRAADAGYAAAPSEPDWGAIARGGS